MSTKNAWSITKGYTFLFKEKDCQIEAWFSAFSGLEKVYVNGDLVSSQRNYKTNSRNTFMVSGNKHSTTLKAVHFFKGPYVCTLSKNGKAYKRQVLIISRPAKSGRTLNFILSIFLFCLLGIVFGILSTLWEFPDVCRNIFYGIIFLGVFLHQLMSGGNIESIIKDEEVV